MPFYRFNKNDKFINIIKAFPKSQFTTWSGSVFYNNSNQSASNTNVIDGHISLYEMNVNRSGEVGSGLIFPYKIKDTGDLTGFGNVGSDTYFVGYEQGDLISGSYPLTASIFRELFNYTTNDYSVVYDKTQPGANSTPLDALPNGTYPQAVVTGSQQETNVKIEEFFTYKGRRRRHLEALINTLNHYTYLSPHYAYSSSLEYANRDLSKVKVNMISIPSLFFGSEIRKGTVNLKFYVTGTLAGELVDIKRNGELVQVGPTGSAFSGTTAGIVLYNEGFIILTGTHNLDSAHSGEDYVGLGDGGADNYVSWLNYGASMPTTTFYNSNLTKYLWKNQKVYAPSSSFELSFKGTNRVPTVTMFAHAEKGMLNHSNNITYVDYRSLSSSADFGPNTNKGRYLEHDMVKIKNTVKSRFKNHAEDFEKQTFISKIGIYDKDRNLIAVAKLANPIKKKEDRDITFKMKLDM